MRKGYGINVGSSSILMIFVLLSLTTFSTLSLVSAKADLRLTEKAAESVSRYYEADARAKTLLAEVAQALEKSVDADSTGDYAGRVAEALAPGWEFLVLPTETGAEISYEVPVDDRRVLQVRIAAPFDQKETGRRYRLTSWQVVQSGTWEEEAGGGMNLWNGELSPLPGQK